MRKVTRLARLALLAMGLTATSTNGQSVLDYRAGSLLNGEPQPVYAADASDSWNRIFNALFTRTTRFRLSEAFASNIPMERLRVNGFGDLSVSTDLFERIELGDRAIEPLDGFPVHMGSNGSPQRVLSDPQFSQLRQALTEALREPTSRPPLSRALMQSDLWAAHDLLAATKPRDEVQNGRREELLGLLAQSVKTLALTRAEIEALPDNLAEAHLPFDLFNPVGDWIEIEYLPNRAHDFSTDFRRATRVFLKPSSRPADRQGWLNGLREKHGKRSDTVASAALVVQLLLVDTKGDVVPSRLTYEVQVRTFGGSPSETKLTVLELSRKAILLDRRDGGLIVLGDREPAYLPSAGNDYFFASPKKGRSGREERILAPLRMRCESCHGKGVQVVLTFSVQDPKPPLPVRILDPADNERARDLARRKTSRPDYVELKRRWDQ
jgi:hypothetical protein